MTSTVDWYRDEYRSGDSEGYQARSAELSLAEGWSREYRRLVEQFRY